MKLYIIFVMGLISIRSLAQNASSRSNEIPMDFRSRTEIQSGSVPRITWKTPVNEISSAKVGEFTIKIELWSKDPLKSAYLFVRDKDSRALRATIPILTPGSAKTSLIAEKAVALTAGTTTLEILAENETGFKCISRREIKTTP